MFYFFETNKSKYIYLTIQNKSHILKPMWVIIHLKKYLTCFFQLFQILCKNYKWVTGLWVKWHKRLYKLFVSLSQPNQNTFINSFKRKSSLKMDGSNNTLKKYLTCLVVICKLWLYNTYCYCTSHQSEISNVPDVYI